MAKATKIKWVSWLWCTVLYSRELMWPKRRGLRQVVLLDPSYSLLEICLLRAGFPVCVPFRTNRTFRRWDRVGWICHQGMLLSGLWPSLLSLFFPTRLAELPHNSTSCSVPLSPKQRAHTTTDRHFWNSGPNASFLLPSNTQSRKKLANTGGVDYVNNSLSVGRQCSYHISMCQSLFS